MFDGIFRPMSAAESPRIQAPAEAILRAACAGLSGGVAVMSAEAASLAVALSVPIADISVQLVATGNAG